MDGDRTVLVVDDEARYREAYARTLTAAGYAVLTAEGAEAALALIRERVPAMVVSDIRMPGEDGIALLRRTREAHPALPFLLVTAYADVRSAVEALRLGAVDYLEKPVDLDELLAAVEETVGTADGDSEERVPADLCEGIVAESGLMQAVLRDAYRVASSDVPVLLTGESGTGKEVVAQFLHRCSDRASRQLVAVNCGAISEGMLASTLFGHRKGAFTGAVADRRGCFREADGGTLFLDEIGEMPLDLQASLLRVLETGRIRPVGCDREQEVDFRLVAATNRNLQEATAAGRFRTDLYYRLNVIAFELPALRERAEDILPLARHFLRSGGAGRRLSPAAARVLQGYGWPGNVRELANAMARASLLARTEVVLPEHLPPALRGNADGSAPASGPVVPLRQKECEAIRQALARTDGNRTRAAELLGISRRALIYKLKRYAIS